jgi:hypothetical protein
VIERVCDVHGDCRLYQAALTCLIARMGGTVVFPAAELAHYRETFCLGAQADAEAQAVVLTVHELCLRLVRPPRQRRRKRRRRRHRPPPG